MNITIIFNIIRTVIDVCLVWLALYLVVIMLKQNTRTTHLFKGVLFILFIKFMTSTFGFASMDYLVDQILTWGFVAIIIVFQPEIRAALEKMGQTKKISSMNHLSLSEKEKILDEIILAVEKLSENKIGALITFERNQSLIDYIRSGVQFESEIKNELLTSIFYSGTALHDGALIIRQDKIVCAAAFYPTTSLDIDSQFGARHRAALGLSEISDALTIVISEETGLISLVQDGKLERVPRTNLKKQLIDNLGWLETKEGDQDV